MKEKLLLWLGEEFIHYGLANSLQKKYDFDLFAVIDNPNPGPKKFHKNQNIVDFQKIWFINDYVSTDFQKPNIQYLKSFEDNYGINIWHVAYTERYFYKVHNPFHKFTFEEILFILEQECKLYEKILNEIKPNFFLVSTITRHPKYLLYELCKSKKIPVLTLEASRFKGKSMISSTIAKVDEPEKFREVVLDKIKNEDDAINYLINHRPPPRNLYDEKPKIPKWEKIGAAINFFTHPIDKNFQKEYLHYGKTKTKILTNASGIIRKKQIKERETFIDKEFIKNVDYSTPFFYFSLQAEPERELLIQSPFFTDQIAVIRNIAKSIPVSYLLYVKEHPVMKKHAGWRNIEYYQQIMDFPNIRMIHPSVDSHELIKKCDLVLTIAGDAAFEGVFYRKPSIVFSDPDYLVLSSVFQVENLNKLPSIILTALKHKSDSSELVKFVNYLEQNSFDFDRVGYFTDLNNFFYYAGFLEEVKITDEKMKDFLKKYCDIFDRLAIEHEKKIKKIQTKV